MMRMRIATLRMVKGSRGEAMIDCSSPIQCNVEEQEGEKMMKTVLIVMARPEGMLMCDRTGLETGKGAVAWGDGGGGAGGQEVGLLCQGTFFGRSIRGRVLMAMELLIKCTMQYGG